MRLIRGAILYKYFYGFIVHDINCPSSYKSNL